MITTKPISNMALFIQMLMLFHIFNCTATEILERLSASNKGNVRANVWAMGEWPSGLSA